MTAAVYKMLLCSLCVSAGTDCEQKIDKRKAASIPELRKQRKQAKDVTGGHIIENGSASAPHQVRWVSKSEKSLISKMRSFSNRVMCTQNSNCGVNEDLNLNIKKSATNDRRQSIVEKINDCSKEPQKTSSRANSLGTNQKVAPAEQNNTAFSERIRSASPRSDFMGRLPVNHSTNSTDGKLLLGGKRQITHSDDIVKGHNQPVTGQLGVGASAVITAKTDSNRSASRVNSAGLVRGCKTNRNHAIDSCIDTPEKSVDRRVSNQDVGSSLPHHGAAKNDTFHPTESATSTRMSQLHQISSNTNETTAAAQGAANKSLYWSTDQMLMRSSKTNHRKMPPPRNKEGLLETISDTRHIGSSMEAGRCVPHTNGSKEINPPAAPSSTYQDGNVNKTENVTRNGGVRRTRHGNQTRYSLCYELLPLFLR